LVAGFAPGTGATTRFGSVSKSKVSLGAARGERCPYEVTDWEEWSGAG
jgi:hypothetical protein